MNLLTRLAVASLALAGLLAVSLARGPASQSACRFARDLRNRE
jgi:hypothetical protein